MTCDLVSCLNWCPNPIAVARLTMLKDRPCNRCIKRNIGHLCHDEPRETMKKSKSHTDLATTNGDGKPHVDNSPPKQPLHPDQPPATISGHELQSGDVPSNRVGDIVQPTPVSASSGLSRNNAGR